jgi:hypothetical protein
VTVYAFSLCWIGDRGQGRTDITPDWSNIAHIRRPYTHVDEVCEVDEERAKYQSEDSDVAHPHLRWQEQKHQDGSDAQSHDEFWDVHEELGGNEEPVERCILSTSRLCMSDAPRWLGVSVNQVMVTVTHA